MLLRVLTQTVESTWMGASLPETPGWGGVAAWGQSTGQLLRNLN